MPATFGTPEHWRDRAEEARIQAKHMLDEDAKRGLLAIAESYERIAKTAEAAQSKAGSWQCARIAPRYRSTRSARSPIGLLPVRFVPRLRPAL
jgi:hypothetical protein